MFHNILLATIISLTASFSWANSTSVSQGSPKNFFDLSATDISGKTIHFSQFRGKVVLIVNTASQCGFTPQLKGLEALQQKYKDQGFTVLAFPSNDFKQDPAENKDVLQFAKNEYAVTFPFFEKAPVRGDDKQPVYQFLVKAKPGILLSEVSWNFEKFLVNRKGEVIERWTSITSPESSSITKKVEKALAEPM